MDEAGATSVIHPSLDVSSLVAELPDRLQLAIVAGHTGVGNVIDVPRVQMIGLALAGFTEQLRPRRLQVLGETEIKYCATLSSNRRREVFDASCRIPMAAVLVTKGLAPPEELIALADRHGVPILTSPAPSSVLTDAIQGFLHARLAPRIRIHGGLLDIHGLGVLLLGQSGIGKSECALDLVQRGHRLIADDVVEVSEPYPDTLLATGPEELRHHLELRGIGIVDVRALFGPAAVRNLKRVELVVRLVRWEEGRQYDRLGIEERHHQLLDTRVPLIEMPVAPGRNLASLIEVAARNHRLKLRGEHSARALVARVEKRHLGNGECETSPAE